MTTVVKSCAYTSLSILPLNDQKDTSNMISSGMRETIRFLVQNKLVLEAILICAEKLKIN